MSVTTFTLDKKVGIEQHVTKMIWISTVLCGVKFSLFDLSYFNVMIIRFT